MHNEFSRNVFQEQVLFDNLVYIYRSESIILTMIVNYRTYNLSSFFHSLMIDCTTVWSAFIDPYVGVEALNKFKASDAQITLNKFKIKFNILRN